MLNATKAAHSPHTATLSCATEWSPPALPLCPCHTPPIYPCFHPCRCRPFIRTYCNCNFNLASLLLSAALDQKPFYFVVKCTMCIFDLKLDSTPLPLPLTLIPLPPSVPSTTALRWAMKKKQKFLLVFSLCTSFPLCCPPCPRATCPTACPLHCPSRNPCNLCVVNNILAQL